jgi:hypothetical protein
MDEKQFARLISRLKNRAREEHTHTQQAVIEEYRNTLTDICPKERNLQVLSGPERAETHIQIAKMLRKAAALQKYLKEKYNCEYPKDRVKETLPLQFMTEDHETTAQYHEKQAQIFSTKTEKREYKPRRKSV